MLFFGIYTGGTYIYLIKEVRMNKLLFSSYIIFSILLGQNNQSAVLTTSSPMGSSLTTDSTGIVTNLTVGTTHLPSHGTSTPQPFLHSMVAIRWKSTVPMQTSGMAIRWLP